MVTKSGPAEQFMLALLEVAELQLVELQAAQDIKAIYRIEGRARGLVSLARLAAVVRPVTDAEITQTEGGTMDGGADRSAEIRERLERRLEHMRRELERKRAELAGIEDCGPGGVPGDWAGRDGADGLGVRLDPDGA